MTTSAVYDLIPNKDGGQNTRYPLGDKPAPELAPPIPTFLDTSGETLTSVDLSWGQLGDGHTKFILQRWRLNIDTAWTLITEPGKDTRNYTDSANLVQGQHVGYRIASSDGVNQSDWAPEAWTYVLTTASSVFIDDFNTQPIGASPGSAAMNAPIGDPNAAWWYTGADNGETLTVQDGPNGKALHFGFLATAASSRCEGAIKLGSVYHNISLSFDLYVPDGSESYGGAAYKHRPLPSGGGATNAKIFRLYNDYYASNPHKIGASLWRVDDDTSELAVDFGYSNGATGPIGGYYSVIINSTKGTWINLRFDITACTASNPTTVTTFLDDAQILTVTVDQYSGAATGYDKGYLLGAWNSGFDADTTMVLDNFRVTT